MIVPFLMQYYYLNEFESLKLTSEDKYNLSFGIKKLGHGHESRF